MKRDKELQQWSEEIVSQEGGRIRGFGEDNHGNISSFEYLVDAVTMIIFTASVQHAAVNFPQYPIMSYTPAEPLATYSPHPVAGQNYRKWDWLEHLPPLEKAHEQLAILYVLGSVNYGRLGQYQNHYFRDERVLPILKNFQTRLEAIEISVRKRNKSKVKIGQLAYTTLLPSSIPQNTNI